MISKTEFSSFKKLCRLVNEDVCVNGKKCSQRTYLTFSTTSHPILANCPCQDFVKSFLQFAPLSKYFSQCTEESTLQWSSKLNQEPQHRLQSFKPWADFSWKGKSHVPSFFLAFWEYMIVKNLDQSTSNRLSASGGANTITLQKWMGVHKNAYALENFSRGLEAIFEGGKFLSLLLTHPPVVIPWNSLLPYIDQGNLNPPLLENYFSSNLVFLDFQKSFLPKIQLNSQKNLVFEKIISKCFNEKCKLIVNSSQPLFSNTGSFGSGELEATPQPKTWSVKRDKIDSIQVPIEECLSPSIFARLIQVLFRE